jgi:hypothetical protein
VIADPRTIAEWRQLARDLRAHAETLRPEGKAELVREAEEWERKASDAETAAGIVAGEPPGPRRIKRLRDKAEECRMIADQADTQTIRESYLRLAEAYDLLARQDEVLVNPWTLPANRNEAG